MIGMTLENAIRDVIKRKPYTTFLVTGTTFRGDIHSYGFPDSAKFIYIRECVDIETTIRELVDTERSEIVLIQYDCYVFQIWQLTVQAFIEHFGISDHIKRICFSNTCKQGFCVGRFDEISVTGTNDAYHQLIHIHKAVDLSQYLIDSEAVACYLDIYSSTGKLRQYICETSAEFDSPFDAYGVFCRDFPFWGLDDDTFLSIALNTISGNQRYAETAKKWKRILNTQL